MININIELANNGVIKIVEDDNINGAGEVFTTSTVYLFEDDPEFKNRLKFINDICLDVGLEKGSDLDPKKLEVKVTPKPKKLEELTAAELKARITSAERLLDRYKKQLTKYEVKS